MFVTSAAPDLLKNIFFVLAAVTYMNFAHSLEHVTGAICLVLCTNVAKLKNTLIIVVD